MSTPGLPRHNKHLDSSSTTLSLSVSIFGIQLQLDIHMQVQQTRLLGFLTYTTIMICLTGCGHVLLLIKGNTTTNMMGGWSVRVRVCALYTWALYALFLLYN